MIRLMENSIKWGRGSGFNFGRIDGSNVRVERSNHPKGWCFLASDDKLTYMHIDDRYFKTKEELDDCILSWLKERKINENIR